MLSDLVQSQCWNSFQVRVRLLESQNYSWYRSRFCNTPC